MIINLNYYAELMTNPGNIVRIRSRNNGRASVYEANMWAQKWQTGLFSGLGVTQNTSADMNVLVGGSASSPDVVIGSNPAGYNIALDLIGKQAIAITKPASNSRISSIIAYTNDLSIASTDTSTTGSPSSCGLIVVNGATSATPVAPTDSEIRTAITADGATGSQATYCVIALITVASTTTTITNTLIAVRKSLLTADKVDFKTDNWWEELGRTSLSTAGNSISVNLSSKKKYLLIIVNVDATGAIAPWLRFNADANNNYSFRYAISQGGGANVVSTDGISIDTGGSASPYVAHLYVENSVGKEKQINGRSTARGGVGASNIGAMLDVFGKWVNASDAIDNVRLVNRGNPGGSFSVGSELIVLGHN